MIAPSCEHILHISYNSFAQYQWKMFDTTVKATKIRKFVKFLDEVLAKKGKHSGDFNVWSF
jgi:hypothetical protein